MKKKFLSKNLFEQQIRPNENLTFSEKSFFPALSMPPRGLFMATHGVTPVVGVHSVCGTIYICREDPKDSLPFNYDVYSVVVDKTEQLELKKVDERDIDFHWAPGLPTLMQKDAPREIKEKLARVTRKL